MLEGRGGLWVPLSPNLGSSFVLHDAWVSTVAVGCMRGVVKTTGLGCGVVGATGCAVVTTTGLTCGVVRTTVFTRVALTGFAHGVGVGFARGVVTTTGTAASSMKEKHSHMFLRIYVLGETSLSDLQ